MQLTPLIAIHMTAAIGAVVSGPVALWARKGNITGHRKFMRNLYLGACGVAGGFTLLPGRYLGALFRGQLGLL